MRLALLLALLLLAPVALARDGAADWSLARLIDERSAKPRTGFEAFDAASLNVFDFEGDGVPEIVSHNDNNRVYVIDSGSGKIRAEIETTHPKGWAARDINPVAIGDLFGDGRPCLVVPNGAAYLTALCLAARTWDGRLVFEKRWEIRVDAALHEPDFHETHPWIQGDGDTSNDAPGLDGNAFLADVDGEPGLEIFVETDGYPGQLAYRHDGENLWSTSWHDGNAGVVVADLAGDGRPEAVFASDAGVVTAFDAREGKLRWSFEARKHGANPGSITVAPVVADLDGKPGLELVFAARNVASPERAGWQERSHAVWFALRADGSVLWKASEDWMNPLAYTRPALVDADGDGGLDVVAMDWNTVGHKPGAWETTSRGASLFALDGATGRALWHRSVDARWSNKDVVVVGDSVIASEQRGEQDGLGLYALRDGARRGWHALPDGWEAMRGPVAYEVAGRVHLAVPLGRPDPAPAPRELDVGHRDGAIAIIDTASDAPIASSANHLHNAGTPEPMRAKLEARIPGPALALVLGALLVAAQGRRLNRR